MNAKPGGNRNGRGWGWRAGIGLLGLALWAGGCAGQREASQGARPFDEEAVAEWDIAAALPAAAGTGRRVLLVFGANWCRDSRAMYKRLTADPAIAPVVRAHYAMVLVDVGERDGAKWDAAVVQRYGRPFAGRGIPALVVLDAEGRQLTTQANNPLVDTDHARPEKVRQFLAQWAAGDGD